VLELDAGVRRCEVPIGLGVTRIAVVFPCGDFIDECLFVGDVPVEALGRENAKLGFSQIEPTAMLLA
jgi:hypothetical protein